MTEFAVGMYLPHPGPRADEARRDLAAALPDATVGEPDDTGVFEILLDATD